MLAELHREALQPHKTLDAHRRELRRTASDRWLLVVGVLAARDLTCHVEDNAAAFSSSQGFRGSVRRTR